MKLVTVPQMLQIEKEADSNNLTYEKMMENAGYNLSREVLRLFSPQDDDEEIQILGLVGPGNNGGDTLVALTRLAEKGWTARAYLVHRKASNDQLIKRLEDADGEIYRLDKDEKFIKLQAFLESADVVLDGLLGTGFKLPLRGEIDSVLETTKEILSDLEDPPYIVAVDCPSGVDCETGDAAPNAIPADMTVTMAAVKHGLLKLPAFDLVGELNVVSIGSLEELPAWKEIKNEVADSRLAIELLPARSTDAHKGTFGTAVVAAGSVNYTGAALLAGKAAYRSGVGLVSLAIPSPLHGALAGQFPEATWLLLPHETGVIAASAAEVLTKNLDRATALLVGPGLGLEDTTGEFLADLLKPTQEKNLHGKMGFIHPDEKKDESKQLILPPMVIDADGLKLLSKIPDWDKLLPQTAVLTPHPGEMAVLTGLTIDEIQKDRVAVAVRFSKDWGHVVVLKGAFTVIAAPDGRTTIIPVATSALARAGTGDVLAGIITGLRAQGLGAYDSSRVGAWIHAQAGLFAEEYMGSSASVMAGDILEAIPDVMAELF